MNSKILFYTAILLLVGITGLFCEEKIEKQAKLKEDTVETFHSLLLNGSELKYKATAGTLLVTPKASIFYISYTKEGDEPSTARPITFCFNGGPGSSSVWLNMGAFGPKILAVNEEGVPLSPPHFVDNAWSLLDLTDLVFVDPMSTGYSVAESQEEAKAFYEVEEDIKLMSQFIRQFVTKNNRWLSPKYIMGESYGTTRSAGIINRLNDNNYMAFKGIIMLSAALNFQTFVFSGGNDLPYITFLPSYASSALYHNKIGYKGSLEQLLKEVENFAIKDYSHALMLGDSLPPEEKERIAKVLSSYIGLDTDYIKTQNLRVPASKFGKKIMGNGYLLGRFDSRFGGFDINNSVDYCRYDPSFEMVLGPMTASYNFYLRNGLKWIKDEEYQILAQLRPWNYGNLASNKYLNMSEDLSDVLTKHPETKLFVASGLYDLGIPYLASQYAINHLDLNPKLIPHITHEKYDAGHMMYFHLPSRIKLRKDLEKFYRVTSNK